jgi:hypothetical protein
MYTKTQSATVLTPVLIITGVIITTVFFAAGYGPVIASTPFIFLALMVWLFGSLTVSVTGEGLEWHFGPGLLRWKRRWEEIESVTLDRSSWMDGWGIRIGLFGVLFNVGGYDYLRVTLKSGKRLGIGTDDSEGLLAAVQTQIDARH